MTLLSEIYDVTLKLRNRGGCKKGYIRPTIGEFFMTHKNWVEIPIDRLRLELFKTPYTIEEPVKSGIIIKTLTENKVLLVYEGDDENFFNLGVARVATIDNDVITYGPEFTFSNMNQTNTTVSLLSDSKALVCSHTYGDPHNTDLFLLNITGDVVSLSSTARPLSTYNNGASMVEVGSYKSVLCIKDNEGLGKVRVISAPTTSITMGSWVTFDSIGATYPYVTKLADDKALLVYKSTGVGLVSCVLTISGTSVTVGTKHVIVPEANYTIGNSIVEAISEDKAVVVFSNLNTYTTEVCTLSISDTTVSTDIGITTIDTLGTFSGIDITKISNNEVFVSYRNFQDSNKGKACILSVGSSEVTIVPELVAFLAGDDYIYESYSDKLFDGRILLSAYGSVKYVRLVNI